MTLKANGTLVYDLYNEQMSFLDGHTPIAPTYIDDSIRPVCRQCCNVVFTKTLIPQTKEKKKKTKVISLPPPACKETLR